MMSDPRFLLGADPELFCVDKDGKYISAVGKFGGTKAKPKPTSAAKKKPAKKKGREFVEYWYPFPANELENLFFLASNQLGVEKEDLFALEPVSFTWNASDAAAICAAQGATANVPLSLNGALASSPANPGIGPGVSRSRTSRLKASRP